MYNVATTDPSPRAEPLRRIDLRLSGNVVRDRIEMDISEEKYSNYRISHYFLVGTRGIDRYLMTSKSFELSIELFFSRGKRF